MSGGSYSYRLDGSKRGAAPGTDVVVLGWWALGRPLTEAVGLRDVLMTLRERLPEAVPTRWDVYDTYRHTLADEGFEALIEFIDANRDDALCLRVKAPARDVTFKGLGGWGLDQREGCLRASHLRIELNARILDGRKAPERLAAAFEALSVAAGPFYAEARILEGLPVRADQLPGREAPVYPVDGNRWWGLPRTAPFAAVLGAPYAPLWPSLGHEVRATGLRLAGPSRWERHPTPLPWTPPEGLCQPVDCHWEQFIPDFPSDGASFTLVTPQATAALWPFDPEMVPRSPVPDYTTRLLALQARMQVGGEEIRRVAADDADGEVFEAWERVSAEPEIRAVYASKTPEPEWTWRIEIAGLEFVRAEPLVSELNRRLEAALAAVPGVTAVTGEDREVLIVAGTPAGHDLMVAATAVIDAVRDDLKAHYNGL